MIDDKPRFNKSELNSYININNGIYLAGVCSASNDDGSLYFIKKKTGEDFINIRLDGGTTFFCNSNAGGTFVADTTTTGGKDYYVWSLQLA